MTRRAFLFSALASAAALLLLRIKGGAAAIVTDSEPAGQFPMSVPYTIAADPPKKYLFFPLMGR